MQRGKGERTAAHRRHKTLRPRGQGRHPLRKLERGHTQTPVVGDRTGRLPATCDEDGLPVEDGSGSSPCIIRADAENPPDWSQAPEEPPGYALVPGEYPFFMGLTMDFLGYMVPTFDFQTEYLNEAPGDHYEETNSIGPESLVNWRASFEECLEAFPPP